MRGVVSEELASCKVAYCEECTEEAKQQKSKLTNR